MENIVTIKELTEKIEKSSSDFEKTNTELKRRYLIWNIETFNIISKNVSVGKGTFGTGYPFYALGKNLEGTLPIIQEQIRYNRQLVKDGEPYQKSIWLCKSCIQDNYSHMPDLKTICNPCPNVKKELKPRKLINRLPDIDMWLVCEDGCVKQAQEELEELLKKYNMCTSDIAPISSIEDVYQIAKDLKAGIMPKRYLPIDAHIIEYSKIKSLIEQVPQVLNVSKTGEIKPYLPIRPKSYRKKWQYDDEAYNYIYDYLSAFTPFNFTDELNKTLIESRKRVISEHTPEELFDFMLQSATEANFRRFQSIDLEQCFMKKIEDWKLEYSLPESKIWKLPIMDCQKRIDTYNHNLESENKVLNLLDKDGR